MLHTIQADDRGDSRHAPTILGLRDIVNNLWNDVLVFFYRKNKLQELLAAPHLIDRPKDK
jgi:hypothetical protein